MSLEKDLDRRGFLAALLAAAAGGSLAALGCGGPDDVGERLAEQLFGRFSDPSAMRQLGAAILEQAPLPPDRGRLIDEIFSAPRWNGAAPEDAPTLLVEQIRSDFEEGRIERVEGWVLSRTEARFYALFELSSR